MKEEIKSKVAIVIPVYLRDENQDFIDTCLESIERLDYPKELIKVFISASGKYFPLGVSQYSTDFSYNQRHFAEAINAGLDLIKETHFNPDYTLLLNDDVILTKSSLKEMVLTAQVANDQVLVNPSSNCDLYMYHGLCFTFKHKGKNMLMNQPQYVFEDLEPYLDDLMRAHSNYPGGFFLTQSLCFYCTLIPKQVMEKVGQLDERFKSGCEDMDYCLRAFEEGYKTVIALSAVAWHFSGTTTETTMTQEEKDENEVIFHDKWGLPPSPQHMMTSQSGVVLNATNK